ncbi:Ribonuclease H domain [Forsythia ovata]|uniref:Ribonuclease H domain n=1 Tax=Forsythia ovata TaxID=205694 RepID=A0ABD1S1Z1_9LAMI
MLGRLLVDDTEVVVMRNGLRFTKQASFQVMEVKCDSLRLVQNLRADISTAPIAIILFHTVALLYDGDGDMCQFIPRDENKVAYMLASFARLGFYLSGLIVFLVFLSPTIRDDLS